MTIDLDRAGELEHALRFEAEDHLYFLGRRRLPSNTQVLEDVRINDYSMVPDHILKPAQELGTWVHLARHLDDFGDLDEGSCNEPTLGHLNGWRRFRTEMEFTPVLSEQPMFIGPGNPTCLPVAGTLDALGPARGRLVLADLKTGSRMPPGVGPQTAGYAHMCRQNNICDPAERWAVQTFADGRYKLHPLDDVRHLHAFLYAVWLYHFKRGFE